MRTIDDKRIPEYNIGDRVFHIIPESTIGVVIDIRYIFSCRVFEYQVAFSENTESFWYHGHELSKTKNFV